MNERCWQAIKFLIRHSSLENNPLIGEIINTDSRTINIGRFDEFEWCETDRILIGILETVIVHETPIRVSDLLKLDEMDRQAAVDAIRISFFGLDPLLHEVG